MEVFVDFGLFELIAVLGMAALARAVYSRRWLGVAFVLASLAAPTTLLIVSQGGGMHWLAAGCLITAIVNSTVVVGAMQRGDVPILRILKRPRNGPAAHDPANAVNVPPQMKTNLPSRSGSRGAPTFARPEENGVRPTEPTP